MEKISKSEKVKKMLKKAALGAALAGGLLVSQPDELNSQFITCERDMGSIYPAPELLSHKLNLETLKDITERSKNEFIKKIAKKTYKEMDDAGWRYLNIGKPYLTDEEIQELNRLKHELKEKLKATNNKTEIEEIKSDLSGVLYLIALHRSTPLLVGRYSKGRDYYDYYDKKAYPYFIKYDDLKKKNIEVDQLPIDELIDRLKNSKVIEYEIEEEKKILKEVEDIVDEMIEYDLPDADKAVAFELIWKKRRYDGYMRCAVCDLRPALISKERLEKHKKDIEEEKKMNIKEYVSMGWEPDFPSRIIYKQAVINSLKLAKTVYEQHEKRLEIFKEIGKENKKIRRILKNKYWCGNQEFFCLDPERLNEKLYERYGNEKEKIDEAINMISDEIYLYKNLHIAYVEAKKSYEKELEKKLDLMYRIDKGIAEDATDKDLEEFINVYKFSKVYKEYKKKREMEENRNE
jgi:hypothetical protein